MQFPSSLAILGLRGRSYIDLGQKGSMYRLQAEQGRGVLIMNHSPSWYAVWTRSRQEKVAAATFAVLGIQHYLPLKSEYRQWSDRKQKVEVPLFTGYLFVYIDPFKDSGLRVLQTPGVVAFCGNQTGPVPIPEKQIEDIRAVLNSRAIYSVQALLQVGDRVRVARGTLAGIEGTLTHAGSEVQVLVSIDMVRQSLAVRVAPEDIERIPEASSRKECFTESTAA